MSLPRHIAQRRNGFGDSWSDFLEAPHFPEVPDDWPSDDRFAGVTGGASGYEQREQVVANGRIYNLPSGIAFPPPGWIPWSHRAQEEWLISVGATLAGPANIDQETRQYLDSVMDGPTDAQIAEWKRFGEEQEQGLVGSAVEDLKRVARAGGAGAEAAVRSLAESGDVFAKIALAFGIGYGAVTIALAVGGGVFLVFYLKK